MASSRLTAVLCISLSCNIFALALAAYVVHEKGGFVYLKSKFSKPFGEDADENFSAYYLNRVSVFKMLENFRDDVYFIGDSITDIGEWQELLSNPDVKNRGINGDTTTGVLHRLNEVVEGNPRKIFLMCGINNLQKRMSVERIMDEYNAIVFELQRITPPAKIYLQSVIPVNQKLYRENVISRYPSIHMPEGDEIDKLNSAIEELAGRYHNVYYVDLAPLHDGRGDLVADYTIDGLHLNGSGLAAWAEIIEPLLQG